jgi:VanW like protein
MMTTSQSSTLIQGQSMARWLGRITTKALFVIIALLALTSEELLPTTSVQAASAADEEPIRYYSATGHNLSGQIKAFYDHNGGEAIFGLPITEAVRNGDRQLQYFERACFELHQGAIALSLIGRAVTEGRTDPAFAWLNSSPAADRTFYPRSGHTLGGAFGWFWQTRGALPIFGYPISEEFVEGGVLIQYFERARFQYHPDLVGAEVQVSALGRDYAQRMGVSSELLAPVPPIVRLGTATMAIPTSTQHNVKLASQKIDGATVMSGEALSFLQTIGEVSTRAGYEPGQAIVNGEVASNVGGGICYVSTLLYRAAFLAGLPIVERHPHSVMLGSLSDVPGFDAAVDTSGPDLRWRNDTPHEILVTASLDDGRLTVALWGQGDGRKTTMLGPRVQRGTATQTTSISRTVMTFNGTLIRTETVQSRYRVVSTEARTRPTHTT